jgi:acetylornithine deacetylase/succinyl-diaminopimelate desuccinylase-like protein
MRAALCGLVILCGAAAAEPGEWGRDAPGILARYLRVDTTNPPGNEAAGAAFFAAILREHNLAFEIVESAPGRANLWARLEGGKAPALLLLNHMDTVPADPRYWATDPLSGSIADGYVNGRGAIDMKGLAVAQLQAFLALAASGKRLTRDVVFMATADEEAGGALGAGWLARERKDLFENVGYILNEGGAGVNTGRDVIFTIEVTQKVPLWLRLTARGTPGHGSVPGFESAVTRLLRAGARLADSRFEARATPSVAAMFAGLAPFQTEALRAHYADIATAVRDPAFMHALEISDPRQHALLRSTCAITRLEASDKINVVPPEASMEIDCRLLPDEDPAAVEAAITTIVNDPAIGLERLMAFTPAVSPADTPLYALIERLTAARHPGSATIAGVSTGFTDSHFFRDMGIVSYGFSPIVHALADLPGVHGNDERVAVDALVTGTDFLVELVQTFATQP